MKKIAIRIALLVFISGCIGVLGAHEAYAGQAVFPVNQSLHFNSGVNASSWSGFTMTGSKDPSLSAASGYVLPNMQGSSYAPSGGAIGETALGVDRYTTSNHDKKVALFCFLQKKNGVSLANRDGICTGSWTLSPSSSDREWERTGSALIVHQLLDTDPKSGRSATAKTIKPDQWDELKKRLIDNTDVVMSYNPTWTTFHWNGSTFAGYYMSDLVNTAGVKMNSGDVYDAMAVTYGESDSTLDKTDRVWQFTSATDPSKIYYALVLNCANPIGGLLGLPDIPDVDEYSLTPTLTAPSAGDVARGDKITAEGSVKNVGDAVNGKSWYITRLTYNAGSNPSDTAARNTNTTGSLCNEFDDNGCTWEPFSDNFAENGSATGSMPEFTVPSTATAGMKYCFVVSVRNPTQVSDSPAWRHSAMRCVTVKRDFVLIPLVESVFGGLSDDSVVDPGESGTIQYSLENTGKDTSTAVEWRLTHYVYLPASQAIPSVSQKAAKDSSAQEPCEAFPGTGLPLIRSKCTSAPPDGWTSSSVTVQSGSDNKLNRATGVFTVPADADVGTKYCWVASVRPPTADSASGTWSHSDMICIVVGKEPKMQVWGGDVRSGGGITTSISTIQNKTYGSWVEYAALSKMQNVGFASGAGLNKGSSSDGQASWSALTFANTGSAGCVFGCYNFALSAPAISGQFIANNTNTNLTGTRDVNNLTSGVYRATGGVSLSGTTLSAGKTIIIDADGPVTILGSITYEDTEYKSVRELPQLIIKAPTINIRNEASQVDAWLLAVIDDENNPNNHKGVLNTCSNVYGSGYDIETGALTDGRCNTALTVNGPVVADIVYLRRTGGSGTTEESRGDPAEIFNLRADAYMWASAYGSQANQIHTVHSKELSPRF